ncbi:GNAT family N-acetyltransferase [Planococcus sp. N028]|uniref:GNAT family N-acetyltransferase n=1 Tax=Planococcus shixiaomingii TaxID=3058393 RepID=A0ABT8N4J4_9BACL|nr:GNAT family N-acetyltransferase [Planococcus sp. N028]MDN7242817.1 GNAT family N-acetyltransferase [Planococcus sp. N028]
MEKQVTIRRLETNDDMRLIQILEREVWNMDPIPTHQTFTASKNGGILVGAFNEDKLIGYCYGFAGFNAGKAYLCSHMMGIHPDFQSAGIGRVLKEEQRKIAQDIGYDLIQWTFDPLESRNAYLNTSKLKGICSTYIENCYGDMDDGLNRGLPTDRLQIEWWISSEHVTKGWKPEQFRFEAPFSTLTSDLGHPVLEVKGRELEREAEAFEIPVPKQFQAIKKEQPELAMDWRLKIRAIFQQLFAEGYALAGVRKTEEAVQYYQFILRQKIQLQQAERGET